MRCRELLTGTPCGRAGQRVRASSVDFPDPLARWVLVVLALDRAPGHPVGPALVVAILVPGAIEGFL